MSAVLVIRGLEVRVGGLPTDPVVALCWIDKSGHPVSVDENGCPKTTGEVGCPAPGGSPDAAHKVEVSGGQVVYVFCPPVPGAPGAAARTAVGRAVAGLAAPRAGTVWCPWDVENPARPFIGPPPDRKVVGYVAGGQGLFPRMTVGQNVAFGGAADADVVRLLRDVELSDRLRDRPAARLGPRQRFAVELAAALAAKPHAVVVDLGSPPFGTEDADQGPDRLLRQVAADPKRSKPAVLALVDRALPEEPAPGVCWVTSP